MTACAAPRHDGQDELSCRELCCICGGSGYVAAWQYWQMSGGTMVASCTCYRCRACAAREQERLAWLLASMRSVA